MVKKRLSADNWIEAGLGALATYGPASLRAEALARELGTTKGSFYWHFKDLPGFLTQLAEAWKREAATSLVGALEDNGPVADRLKKIAAGGPAEAAMRAWASENDTARNHVDEIDKLRLEATSALLRDVGVSNRDLAHALYAAGVGLTSLPRDGIDSDKVLSTLIDLVLALR